MDAQTVVVVVIVAAVVWGHMAWGVALFIGAMIRRRDRFPR